MGEIHKRFFVTITLLIFVAVAFVSCTDGRFNHPAIERLRQLEELPKLQGHGEINREAIEFVIDEISKYLTSENRGEGIIVILKIYSILHVYGKSMYDWSINKATSMAFALLLTNTNANLTVEFRNNQELAEHLLDWNFHLDMLEHLNKYHLYSPLKIDWVSYAYLLAVENSSHLKNSFTKGMLLKLNKIRNYANMNNAIHLYQRNNNIELNDIIRFPFDKIMIELELFDRNETSAQYSIPELKRIFIEESLKDAFKNAVIWRYDNIYSEHRAKPLYMALLELPDDELANHVDALAYAMGWWSVKIESDFIKKLNSMLKSKCVRLEIDGLTERLRDMEFAMANAAEISDESWLFNWKYVEYYKILINAYEESTELTYEKYQEFKTILYQLVMFNAETFDDHEKLREYDRFQSDIIEFDVTDYDPDSNLIGGYDFDWDEISEILSEDAFEIEELLELITTSENTFDDRNRIRIFIRYIMHMCNSYRHEDSEYMMDNEYDDKETISKIASLYIKLMRFGGDVFINDTLLIRIWYHFIKLNPRIISEVLNEEMIESLTHYNNAANPSRQADAILYIFLTQIANSLAENDRISDGSILIKRILELEQTVGYADDATTFIQNYVLYQKQSFYTFYAQQAAEHQTNLTEMVKHHIELIASYKYWTDYKPYVEAFDPRDLLKRQLLDAILTAIVNNSNAEHQLNDQLRYRVSQLLNGLIRDYGMDDAFADKVHQYERVFGNLLN